MPYRFSPIGHTFLFYRAYGLNGMLTPFHSYGKPATSLLGDAWKRVVVIVADRHLKTRLLSSSLSTDRVNSPPLPVNR